MTRLIDADALKESIDEHVYLVHHGFNETEYGCTQYGIHQIIDDAPTVDAVPVKRGKWIHRGCGIFACSKCGKDVGLNVYTGEKASETFKWCPHCGARMDADALTKYDRKAIDEEIERAWKYAETD